MRPAVNIKQRGIRGFDVRGVEYPAFDLHAFVILEEHRCIRAVRFLRAGFIQTGERFFVLAVQVSDVHSPGLAIGACF